MVIVPITAWHALVVSHCLALLHFVENLFAEKLPFYLYLLLLFTFAHMQAAIDAARSMQPHVTPPFVTTRDILYAIYSTVH